MKSIRCALRTSSICAGVLLCSLVHAAGAGIAGTYHVAGENPDGTPYGGVLSIAQKGEVYELTWESPSISKGVGILLGSKLVAGYGNAACGVIAYTEKPGGVLEGIWAMSNSVRLGTETANPANGGSEMAGDYVVVGQNTDKTKYKGALFVKEDTADKKLSFLWRTGPDAQGFGFRTENIVAATFGPATCGVVVYNVAEATLTGRWSLLHGTFGSEKAQKLEK